LGSVTCGGPLVEHLHEAPRAAPRAETGGGKAEIGVAVKIEPTDQFTATVKTLINNELAAFRFTGAPAIGTTGQTGYTMPEVHPENQ
jgi:hypothetical protein